MASEEQIDDFIKTCGLWDGNPLTPFGRACLAAAIDAANAPLLEAKDQAYHERNHLVAALARLYPSGVAKTDIPGWDEEWHGCVYIDLPTGQISYHFHDSEAQLFDGLPAYDKSWDGHSKDDVHARLAGLSNAPLLEELEKAKENAAHWHSEAEHWNALACDDPGKNPPIFWKDEVDNLRKREGALLEAVRVAVYEITHLSPMLHNGSHKCTISKECLEGLRAALRQFLESEATNG